jgi:excisionase family DNA binding protein
VLNSSDAQSLDTAQSLAKFLNVSTAYIRKLTRLNKLPVIRIGRAVRFDRAAILEALRSDAKKASQR